MDFSLAKNYTFFTRIIKENFDLFFLSIYFFSLPIAKVTSIQGISLALFILYFLIENYKNLKIKRILYFKNIITVFTILLLLAILSLFFTPDIIETLKEIKSELIRSFIVLIIFFSYTLLNNTKKITYILYIIATVLLVHTFLNLFIWYSHNMWPYRAGGLLDSGGGERFGIWATYALAMPIAFLFSKYKYIAIPFSIIAIISIVANNTRATFVAIPIMLIMLLLFFIKNKYIKISFLFLITIFIILFINYSKNFTNRYNAHSMITNISLITKYTPREYTKLVSKHGWDNSAVTRLSMWKSVIIYRLNEPYLPRGYGRFVYGKGIKNDFKNSPQNLPYNVFPQTHNEFIGMLYSLGIMGLLALIYFLYYQLKISYKIFEKATNESHKIWGVFVFLGTIGFIISMMFGSFFGDSEVKFFYPLYGIILGIYYKENATYEKTKIN